MNFDRRLFLKGGAAATVLGAMPVRAHDPVVKAPFPIFDTHPHYYTNDLVNFPHRPDISDAALEKVMNNPMTGGVVTDYWDKAGILMGTGVQYNTVYSTNNDYLLHVAAENPSRILPVVILDATDAATPDTLRTMARDNGIAGVRLFGFANRGQFAFFTPEADPAWEAINELGIVAVLMLVGGDLNRTMGVVDEYATRYPNVRIEIDHAGYPSPRNNPDTFGLPENFLKVAQHRNVYYKMTSFHNVNMIEGQGHTVKDWYDFMKSHVGADRMVWGSDMGNTPGIMEEHYAMLQTSIDATAHWNYGDRKAFFFDTAYRLFVPGGTGDYNKRF